MPALARRGTWNGGCGRSIVPGRIGISCGRFVRSLCSRGLSRLLQLRAQLRVFGIQTEYFSLHQIHVRISADRRTSGDRDEKQ
jgi:hypothetical protein